MICDFFRYMASGSTSEPGRGELGAERLLVADPSADHHVVPDSDVFVLDVEDALVRRRPVPVEHPDLLLALERERLPAGELEPVERLVDGQRRVEDLLPSPCRLQVAVAKVGLQQVPVPRVVGVLEHLLDRHVLFGDVEAAHVHRGDLRHTTIIHMVNSAPARLKRRRLSVEDRRAELLRACLDLLGRRPWDEVTMADVADAAVVSKPLLYHYFSTKTDLYRATVTAAAEQLRQATQPDPNLPVVPRMRAALDAHLDWIDAHALAYRAVIQGGISSDPVVQHEVERSRIETVERLADAFGIENPSGLRARRVPGLDRLPRMDQPRVDRHKGDHQAATRRPAHGVGRRPARLHR